MSGRDEMKEAGGASRDGTADSAMGRQRSTIGFPYSDLNDAVHFAQAVHDHVGLGDCDDDQLAAWVEQSPKSSGFRTQLSAARLFGFIETDATGRHKLTSLGQHIVDPGQARGAKVQAFMNVPLYRAAYERYKGTVLPPPAALGLDFVRLGVAVKQKDRARVAFNKSAEQAGFFEHDRNRLVQPGIVPREAAQNSAPDLKDDTDAGSGNVGSGLDLDPLLIALLEKVPPKTGGWNAARRLRWFRTFAMNVSQVYDDDDKPVELKIDLAGEPE